MDYNQRNVSCRRPYQTTCGMGRPSMSCHTPQGQEASPSCPCFRQPDTTCKESDPLLHADHLPLGMAYVPCQKFDNTFHLCDALHMGTIFPALCMPFCGKRGGCR